MKKTIFFTGGHHNSALQVAKALKSTGYNIVWLGQKFNHADQKTLSAEYQEVKNEGLTFVKLSAGRFYRKFNLFEFFKLALSFFYSLYLVLRHRPALIFSAGGYMAVPVVFAGFILRVPSFTHEQTVVSGWANKAITPFVKKVLLSHESSKANYPLNKAIHVGLPISKETVNPKNTKIFNPKLLFITCGKQGSHLINSLIFPLIPKLVKDYTVIHQTGTSKNTDDLKLAKKIKDSLGEYSDRYIHKTYFFEKESATFLRSAELVIARGGAHTVYELITLNKKAIIIPLSWVSHQEQELNAALAKKQIDSEVLNEKTLTSDTLYEAISRSAKKPKRSLPDKLKNNATESILEIVKEEIGLP